MKLSAKKTFAALALLTGMSAGTTQAMNTTTLPLSSVSGVTSSDLRVIIEDGVASIFGSVESGVEAKITQAHVEKLDGVNEVSNNIFIN